VAISVAWATKIINVPQAYLTDLGGGVYELDVNQFRLDLKALEADVNGITFVDTHQHNPPVTVGGVTLARVVEIINGYTVTFEDGQYAVNLVGANNNIQDVSNVNQVSVRPSNTAGMVVQGTGDLNAIADAIWAKVLEGTLTAEQIQRVMLAVLAGKATATQSPSRVRYRDVGDAKDRVDVLHSEDGDRTSVTLDGT